MLQNAKGNRMQPPGGSLRWRQAQSHAEQTLSLICSMDSTYSSISRVTRPLGRILTWVGTFWGGYKNYTWYKSAPTPKRLIFAALRTATCFVGARLASLLVDTYPFTRTLLRYSAEICGIDRQAKHIRRQGHTDAGWEDWKITNMFIQTRSIALQNAGPQIDQVLERAQKRKLPTFGFTPGH